MFCLTLICNFDTVFDGTDLRVFLSYTSCMHAIAADNPSVVFIAEVFASTWVVRLPVLWVLVVVARLPLSSASSLFHGSWAHFVG